MDYENMIRTILDGGIIEAAKEALFLDLDGAWAGIEGVFNRAILPVGYALLCLYFLIELMEKTTHDNFNLEHFIRMSIKLLVGKILMDNSLAFLNGMIAFGNILIGDFSKSVKDLPPGAIDIEAIVADGPSGKISSALRWIQLIVPYLITWFPTILVKVACYARSIEIIVRTMLAPIGMADIYSEGTRGPGFRYLRKFLAVNLQAIVILGILYAATILNTALLASGLGVPPGETISTWKQVSSQIGSIIGRNAIIGFTLTSMITQSKPIANDICGV